MKKIISFLAVAIAALILGNMAPAAFAADQAMPYQYPYQAPQYQGTFLPDQYLWSQVVSQSKYGISLPWGDDGITAFNSLGPQNWIVYQEKPLPEQMEPSQRYHNEAVNYSGTSRPGVEGTWDARDQWPF